MDQGPRVSKTPSDSNRSREEKLATLLPSEKYIILNLYEFAQDAITAVLSKKEVRDSHIKTQEWQYLRERLKQWGNSLSVVEGKLDRMFIKTPKGRDLRELICKILCGIATSLSLYVKLIEPPWSRKDILGNTTKAISGLMPELKKRLEATYEYYSSFSGDLAQDFTSGAKSKTDTLFRIVPNVQELLQHYYPQWEVPNPELLSLSSHGDAEQQIPSAGMSLFQIRICTKFPGINEDLALHLAELNWERLLKIQDLKLQFLESPRPISRATSTSDKNGIYENTSPPSVPPNPTSSLSNSFISISPIPAISESKDTTDELLKTSFSCPICCMQLEDINSGEMWKKHVLKDLQPYSCLFSNCQESNITFDSIDSWISHEFDNHRCRQVDGFICREPCNRMFKERYEMLGHVVENHLGRAFSEEVVRKRVDECKKKTAPGRTICPFCQEEIAETKHSVQSHIGAHLDEIALMVLPLDINILSQIIDQAVNSHHLPTLHNRKEKDIKHGATGAAGPKHGGASDEFHKHLKECRNSVAVVSNQLNELKYQLSASSYGDDNTNENSKQSTGQPEGATNSNSSMSSSSNLRKPTHERTPNSEHSATSTHLSNP